MLVETSASAATSAIDLVTQTTTVMASSSGQSRFELGLDLKAAPPGSTVSTSLFGHLTTRSGFLAALSSAGPSGQIDSTAPEASSCLTPGPKGSSILAIDVVTSPSTVPTMPGGCPGSGHAPTFDLRCTVGSGSCNGVYPLEVTISSGTAVLSRFVTFLTFVERAAPTPLRFAMVLSLQDHQADAVGNLDVLNKALRTEPQVPLDLSISPTAIQQISTTPQGRQAISTLAESVSQPSPVRQLIDVPYVAVDPGALASSGMTDVISRELSRGRHVLARSGLTPPSTAAGWLATSPVTSSTLTGLGGAGVTHLLVPDSSLAQPTATALTWGQPFNLTPSSSSIEALAIDPVLSGQLIPGQHPVLAAERLLAALAFLRFERPSLTTPQGVVAVAPPGWTADPQFLATLFSGLTQNPLCRAAAVASLFRDLSIGANGAPPTRGLAQNGPSPAWPSAQIASFRREQQRQGAFASAVMGAIDVVHSLDDDLLATASDTLAGPSRSVALSHVGDALTQQLTTVKLGSGDITLTSLKGSIPITLTKNSSYTIRGILELRSDHLAFPHGTHYPLLIDSTTKSLRIQTVAITTGDLPLTAELVTPEGGLTIAKSKVIVHATKTSIVAIILTIGAALVLGLWWIRTWWRRPSSKHRRSGADR